MQQEGPMKIRWVLAHEPIELFLRAARQFKATMEETAPGVLDFEIMTLSEYSDRYAGGKKITKHDLLDLMEAGEIEMSQMYTSTLGRKHNRDMWALDMPFLFKDHDHAARFILPKGVEASISRLTAFDSAIANSFIDFFQLYLHWFRTNSDEGLRSDGAFVHT
mmetsp:Transcript_5030/g.6961  ORF Transcript_5030/g.6961 Transcript_5030/m.6961 type:complete len:163 (+) Transcript_5030:97-585(+)